MIRGLKYLLIGASSSAIFLYGVSLLYGLSEGETSLSAIAQKLTLPKCILTRAKSGDNCNARFPQKNGKDGQVTHP